MINSILRKLLNLPLLYWHRYRWRISPTRITKTYQNQSIDRPIFLLGIQGGGLTLISRVLRRHSKAVSATGNFKYWAGPDEMQNVYGSILPSQLTGLHHKIPAAPQYPQRNSLYAIDDLLPLYRQTEANQTPELEHLFRNTIRFALNLHKTGDVKHRFVDKSQTFTVRLGLVNKLLEPYSPYFILVTRNPYAICYRYAAKNYTELDISFEDKLTLASQHWANSFRCALQDAPSVSNLTILRFEDFLHAPDTHLRKICHFLDLSYEQTMLPAPNQNIPLGSTGSSTGDRKWYPIRNDVNQTYLDQLDQSMMNAIKKYVEPQASNWGYSPKGS